jgi:hypothetical protein
MEDAKRKQLESELRRLINAASRNTDVQTENRARMTGSVRVIRRRKGSPDRHIA